MPRDFEVYLEDIRHAVAKIQRYTAGMTRNGLAEDSKTLDAVIRNLEIIGEVAKMIPESIRVNIQTLNGRKSPACATSSPTTISKSIWTLSGTLFRTNCQS